MQREIKATLSIKTTYLEGRKRFDKATAAAKPDYTTGGSLEVTFHYIYCCVVSTGVFLDVWNS